THSTRRRPGGRRPSRPPPRADPGVAPSRPALRKRPPFVPTPRWRRRPGLGGRWRVATAGIPRRRSRGPGPTAMREGAPRVRARLVAREKASDVRRPPEHIPALAELVQGGLRVPDRTSAPGARERWRELRPTVVSTLARCLEADANDWLVLESCADPRFDRL